MSGGCTSDDIPLFIRRLLSSENIEVEKALILIESLQVDGTGVWES